MAEIAALLDHLIETADPDTGAKVQLNFKLGLQPRAGVLRHSDFDGIYCLYMVTRTTGQEEGLRAGQLVHVKEFFGAEAVSSVITMSAQQSVINPNA